MSVVYKGRHRRPDGQAPAPILELALLERAARGITSTRVADLSHPPTAPNGCEGCGAGPGDEHQWSCDEVPAQTFARALAAAEGGA